MVRSVARLVVVVTLAACAARSEGASSPEGPTPPPLAAVPRSGETDPKTSLAAAPTTSASRVSPKSEVAAPAEPHALATSVCPEPMILVDGDWCTDVDETCLEWLDPPKDNPLARCAKYGPSKCVGARLKRRFCIDRDEYVRPGDSLPLSDVSWTNAGAICEKEAQAPLLRDRVGARLRRARAPAVPDGLRARLEDVQLRSRAPARQEGAAYRPARAGGPGGQVRQPLRREEHERQRRRVGIPRSHPGGVWRPGLQSCGWWMAARDRCRPATTAHDEYFHQLQTGLRCCADAPSAPRAP